jgi:hypothetical protein
MPSSVSGENMNHSKGFAKFMEIETCDWIKDMSDIEIVKELKEILEGGDPLANEWIYFMTAFVKAEERLRATKDENKPFLGLIRGILELGLTHVS